MNIVLMENVCKKDNNAGNKARADALSIAVQMGYRHVELFRNGDNKCLIVFSILIALFKTIGLLNEDDIVFVQYPYYPMFVNSFILKVLYSFKKHRKYRIFLLIHDVIGLRENDQAITEKEKKLFSYCDTVICHNDEMRKKIETSNGVRYVELGLFDYLGDVVAKKETTEHRKNEIVIAGNLSKMKSAYIRKLGRYKGVMFHLYGNGYEENNEDNIIYHGVYNGNEIVDRLQGSFGLVWDGEGCESCTGKWGEYLKYNNPHKMSLYIAAGLPVIVWNRAASYKFVEQLGIGFGINSLDEISAHVENMSTEDYSNMLARVGELRKEILQGRMLKSALTR
jgi:hypothetical protein